MVAKTKIQLASAPMRRASSDCMIRSDTTARKHPVHAKEMISPMSYHQVRCGVSNKCLKSVTMYGALGKNMNHIAASSAINPRRRERDSTSASTPIAHQYGIHARNRFHTRNEYPVERVI